jgi:hypothetical protein
MKRFEIRLALAAAFAALLFAFLPSSARAQSIGISSPMTVKQIQPKTKWMKAEVIHADAKTIMVRDHEDERKIYTFNYSDKIQPRMDKINSKGGYQSGDLVKIKYVPGYAVATEIKGKPSKPI